MIEREQAAKLYEVYQRAFDVLCEGYEVLGSLPDGTERDEAVLAHGEATDAVLFGLRARLLAQYPELEASVPEEPFDAHDPLHDVLDEDLIVDAGMLERLSAFRKRAKLVDLPGDPAAEHARLSDILNDLADTLICGLVANPTKLWVMSQFQRSLARVEDEDTEGRDRFGTELETIMGILGIESSDGLLTFYLGGI